MTFAGTWWHRANPILKTTIDSDMIRVIDIMEDVNPQQPSFDVFSELAERINEGGDMVREHEECARHHEGCARLHEECARQLKYATYVCQRNENSQQGRCNRDPDRLH